MVLGKHSVIALILCIFLGRASVSLAQATTTILNPHWQIETLQHQSEAKGIFQKNGFLYVGGKDKVAKIRMSDGSIVWSYETNQGYQPSYPVSNGYIVIFGKYYEHEIVGLDDNTGQLVWTIPTGDQNMSAACFVDELVFVGSYDKHIYGIDWAKGKIRWKTLLGNLIWSTPCRYKDLILIGSYDGYLYAIKQATGKILWKLDCSGRIGSSPVVANDLVFIGVDDQNYGITTYDSSKVQKMLLVIDLREKKIVSRFSTNTEWSEKIVVFGDDVYFFDRTSLFAYNSQRVEFSWKLEVSQGMLPYPLITDSTVIIAMNQQGHHGEHQSWIVIYDRPTGRKLTSSENGGIGMRQPHYTQYNGLVVTTDWMLKAYKIKTLQ